MSWLELIMFIGERGEKILEHRASEVLTDKHRYYRVNGLFIKDQEEGSLDTVYGRGGAQYVWRKRIEVEEPEIVIPAEVPVVIVNDEIGYQ